MKVIIYVCLLASVCCAVPLKSKTLQIPTNIKTKIQDKPLSFAISWSKVESVKEDEPVLGYKVKIIAVEKVKSVIYKFDDDTGELIKTENLDYPTIDANEVTKGNQTVLMASASENPRVTFLDVKTGVPYQYIILAYTKREEGPSSSPIRVQVNGK